MFWEDSSPNPDLRYLVDHPSLVGSSADAVGLWCSLAAMAGMAMNSEAIFLGCFVSGPAVNWDDDQRTKEQAQEKGELFRTYIWGGAGISQVLKQLRSSDYGSGLNIILFQFYLNPLPDELSNLKEIERYRKKEEAIGIPIIVNNENFFDKEGNERLQFLRNAILCKVSLLKNVVKRNKLDFNVEKLRADLGHIFDEAVS